MTRCAKKPLKGPATALCLGLLLWPLSLLAQLPVDIPGIIPLHSVSDPASDLRYQDRILIPDEAAALRDQGLDLSTLEPDETTTLWQPVTHPPTKSEMDAQDEDLSLAAKQSFENVEAIPARSGNFRFVAYPSSGTFMRPLTFLVSKTAHNVLLRKALLRKLGYVIAPNRRVPNLRLKFDTPGSKELFLDNLAQSTFGNTKRWVLENLPESNELVLQDLIAFDSDVAIYNLALGFVPHGILKGRRLLNALNIPFELVDNPESVNVFQWSFGKVVSGFLKLGYEESQEFVGNLDDSRWIARRILNLSALDWSDIVESAQLPKPVSALLLQKLMARRNDLALQLGIKTQPLKYDSQLSVPPELIKGKLVKEDWTGYGSRFAFGDPNSPLSNTELWGLAKSRLLSNVMANSFAQLNDKFIPHTDIEKKVVDAQVKAIEKSFFKFLQTGQREKIPLGVYAFPIFGGGITAARDIIVGSYLGTDNQVQLADSVGVSVYAGAHVGAVGLPLNLSATLQGKATLSRTYSHLRPIKSIKAGLKYPYRNAIVPLFMFNQGNLFDELAQSKFDSKIQAAQALYYTRNQEYQFAKADMDALLITLETAIGHHAPEAAALQTRYDATVIKVAALEASANIAETARETALAEHKALLKKVLNAFAENIGIGESILVTDSIGAGLDLRAGYSLAERIAAYAKATADQVIISRIHILRYDENTVHIYNDLGNMTKLGISFTLKAGIPILEISGQYTAGKARSRYYPLDLNEDLDANPKLAYKMLALRQVMATHSLEALGVVQKPFHIRYDFDQSIGRRSLLWWKWASMNSDLKIEVTHPDNLEQRSLYRKTLSKMSGRDYESVAVALLNAGLDEAIGEEGSITSPTNGRPSDSIWGSSVFRSVTVDGALERPMDSSKNTLKDPFISVVYSWQGWSASRKQAQEILDEINSKNEAQFYPPDTLNGVKNILFYSIDLSYQVYAPALNAVLALNYNKAWSIFRTYSLRKKHSTSLNAQELISYQNRIRRAYAKGDVETYSKYLGKTVNLCEAVLSKEGLFAVFGGSQNLLIASKIQGFREGDEGGDKPYFANTLGEIGSRSIAGPVEDMRSQLKIANSEFFLFWILERL